MTVFSKHSYFEINFKCIKIIFEIIDLCFSVMEGNSTELAIEQSYHYKSRALIWNLNGSSQTPPILAILGLKLFDF